MRSLVPALAFAFSCMGGAATQGPTPPPPAAAPLPAEAPVADAGAEPPEVAQAQSTLDTPGSTAPELRRAFGVLAKARGAAVIPAIAAKLAHKDPTVRRAAVETLGEIGGAKARAALQKQLEAESRPEIRAAIERAMAAATP